MEPSLNRTGAALVQDWGLRPDGPVVEGGTALVLPVRTPTGDAAVLRVARPTGRPRHEHLALRAWDGNGAVRLLRADPHRSALLLERALPGHALSGLGVLDACEQVAALYARLHRPPLPKLDRLSERAGMWAEDLAALQGSALAPRRFVDQAVGLARELAADPATDAVLLHGDLHDAHVLAADISAPDRWPWLAIAPQPLTGDPAYEVAPLLQHRWDEAVASRDLRGALLERLFTVVDVAGLEEDRVRAWVVVREMVNVSEASREAVADRDQVTRSTTIVKAVQR